MIAEDVAAYRDRGRELEREIASLELTLRFARRGYTSRAERIQQGPTPAGRAGISEAPPAARQGLEQPAVTGVS